MKKLKLNLQYLQNAEVLTRSQLKNVLGGNPPMTGGGNGSCTYTSGSVSCTSSSGDCQNLYCDGTRDGLKIQKGVCCDGTKYAIANGAQDCNSLGGTLCCDL